MYVHNVQCIHNIEISNYNLNSMLIRMAFCILWCLLFRLLYQHFVQPEKAWKKKHKEKEKRKNHLFDVLQHKNFIYCVMPLYYVTFIYEQLCGKMETVFVLFAKQCHKKAISLPWWMARNHTSFFLSLLPLTRKINCINYHHCYLLWVRRPHTVVI